MKIVTTTVKLNIAMSYPVKWTGYAVMRDYIQNFFDAVGPKRFHDEFQYKQEGQTLSMSVPRGFDKEWLFYMGTSTKRNSKTMCAGRFGEGFKIASLIAYRDLKLDIWMESRDWRLHVTQINDKIEGEDISFLAYEVSERPYEDNAILTLVGVEVGLYDSFLRAMESFYYEGNPRLGKKISIGEDFAVYHVNSSVNQKKNKGYIYAAYQERKMFHLPIIVCHHTYIPYNDDRDRESFTSRDSTWCIEETFEKVQPLEALEILETLNMCWRGIALQDVYIDTGRLIKRLIDKVAADKTAKEQFLEKYREKLVADFNCMIPKDRKRIALAWYRASKFCKERKVVSYDFQKIGIIDLEQLCEQNHGFRICSKPDGTEKKYIEILEKAAKEILFDIISYNILPKCEIILNRETPVEGCAITKKIKSKHQKQLKLRVEREIPKVYLQKYLFHKDCFGEAFSVYAHELLHQYGGDTSLQFHKAILLMNICIVKNLKKMDEYELRWREVA